jgi:hypothetical protein
LSGINDFIASLLHLIFGKFTEGIQGKTFTAMGFFV